MNTKMMDKLIATIEHFEPSHMSNRHQNLSYFKEEMEKNGYLVEEITSNDVECYWIRVKGIENRTISIGYENRLELEFYKPFLVKA